MQLKSEIEPEWTCSAHWSIVFEKDIVSVGQPRTVRIRACQGMDIPVRKNRPADGGRLTGHAERADVLSTAVAMIF